MFKSALDGLYHREQIHDYIREANARQYTELRPRHTRRKVTLGFALVGGAFTLLWGLANLGQIVTLLNVVK